MIQNPGCWMMSLRNSAVLIHHLHTAARVPRQGPGVGRTLCSCPLLTHIAAPCTFTTHQQLHVAVGIVSLLCPAWNERNLNPIPKNVTYVVICMQVVFIWG